jgi:itaconate CoA-transferase
VAAPLAGIVVVSVEQAIAAPFASRQLADLGATVIKIERPETGDFARHYDGNVSGQSAFFVWANRSKQSVVVDTKADDGNAELEALLAGADVYLHNLSPDAAERAGLDAAAVRTRHPAIIACQISGYGPGGPRSADRAYDLAIQAEAGVFDVTGEGDLRAKVGLSIADIAAGMYALTGILAALVRRERTGEGATVEVAMLDALTEWMSAPLLNAHSLGRTPKRTARRHAQIAPYGTFNLSDGSVVLVAIQNQAEWRRFCDAVLGDASLASDPLFVDNYARIVNADLLEQKITLAFATVSSAETLGRLRQANIAVASVNTLADVFDHPQLRARNRFVKTTLPGGFEVETVRLPIDIDGFIPESNPMVPGLDQHDSELVASVKRSPLARNEGG